MGQGVYLWDNPDFPKFYYNPEVTKPLEEKFIRRFRMVSKMLKSADSDSLEEMSRNLGISETLYSSKIEGIELDSVSMYDSALNNTHPRKEEREVLDMFKLALGSANKPLTHDTVKELHRALMPDHEYAGVYVGNMTIVKREGRFLGADETVIHRGIPADMAEDAMSEFIERYNHPDAKRPLANAVRDHIHFETLHPFVDGNGRVGRALMVMGLCRDMGAPLPLAISKVFSSQQETYYSQFRRAPELNPLDLTYAIKVVGPMLIESLDDTQKVIELSLLRRKAYQAGLNDRQMKVLDRVIAYELGKGFDGHLSNEKYCKMAKCERRTATRDLLDLTDKGLLIKRGQLKGTRYMLPIGEGRENENGGH